jgi:hypothetical protein
VWLPHVVVRARARTAFVVVVGLQAHLELVMRGFHSLRHGGIVAGLVAGGVVVMEL